MATAHSILVSLTDEAQEFQRMQADEARLAARRLGLEARIEFCASTPSRQIQQITEAVASRDGPRLAAVVIQPVAVAGLDALARTALASGVGWITLDSALYLDNLRREFPDQLVALVTADNNQVGRLQARLFRALLPRGGSVVYVEGPSLAPATIHRRTGMQEGLAGSGIQISRTLTGDWTEVGAEKAVTFWLRLGTEKARPDVIAAQNDLMAVGARRAVQGLRPDWSSIPFTGCDGLPDGGQRLVRQRLLTATIVTPTTVGASIELAASFLEGKAVHPVTLLSPRTYPALEDLANANRG